MCVQTEVIGSCPRPAASEPAGGSVICTHAHVHTHCPAPLPAPPARGASRANLSAAALPSSPSGRRCVRTAAPRCRNTVYTHKEPTASTAPTAGRAPGLCGSENTFPSQPCAACPRQAQSPHVPPFWPPDSGGAVSQVDAICRRCPERRCMRLSGQWGGRRVD